MRRPQAIAHFKRRLLFDYHPWRPFMKYANFRFLSIVLLSAAFVSGCRSTGSEFPGKWVNRANPHDGFQIVHNSDEFLIVSPGVKVGAAYKDGTLEDKGALCSANL